MGTNDSATKMSHEKTPSPKSKITLCSSILELDKRATARCGICADPNSVSGLYSLRLFFKFFEFSGHGIPWIVVPLYLMFTSEDPWLMEFLWNLLAGIFLDLIVSFILKTVFKRPRPIANDNRDNYLTISVDRLYSFPSGHCTRAGMLAYFFVANLNLTTAQSILFLFWIFGIAASRLGLGRHYISDVLCGIAIGLLQALFIQWYWMPAVYVHYIKDYFK